MRQAAIEGRPHVDVSEIPDKGAFGPDGLIWWGTTGFMVIEGSMFVIVLIAYYYLRLRVPDWPPSGTGPPDVFYGALNLAVLAASSVPNHLAKLAAERFDLHKVRVWMAWCVAFGLALLAIRAFEFTTLNCRWDQHAYGSVVWALLFLHTMHLATDVVDTGVLATLMVTGPVDKARFIDVSENGLYWYFIVLWWLPVFFTIYVAPRWL
jgi:heme/copper-type cytochrome/quinol oxidase subunit 3